MSEAASAIETPAAATAPAAAEVQTETQTPAAVETSAATPPAASEDDYSWVPAKFMVDGKPDFKNLAKGHANLEKKLGTKVVNLAPEDVAEYAYEPQKLQFDEASTTAFKGKAKELGLSTAQYTALMAEYETAIDNVVMSRDKSEAMLKESWGKEFDGNINAARRAFDEFAPSDLNMEDPALNHPSVLKLLARIGADLSEDSTPAKAETAAGTTQAEIDALMIGNKHFDDPVAAAKVAAHFKRLYDK